MAEPYTRESSGYFYSQGVLLFVLPLPLIWVAIQALLGGDSNRLLASLTALGLLWGAALINRKGLQAEAEFRRRKIASASGTPRKTLAALLVAGGTFVAMAFLSSNDFIVSVVAGALAAFGSIIYYGTDPRGSKGVTEGTHGFTTEEIVEALSSAQQKIDAIDAASSKIPNSELGQRLRRITEKAREIISVIEDDPGDLRRARKFLNTYLDGARKVTEGFAKTAHNDSDGVLEQNFRNVLDTIESTFNEQHEKLLHDDVFDLDVQIEVLKIQLEKEGVT